MPSKVSKEWLNKEQFDNLITICIILIVTSFLWWACWRFSDKDNIVTQIVTAYIFIISTIINFRWGSSRTANRQQETIDQLITPDPGKTTVTTTQTNDSKASEQTTD